MCSRLAWFRSLSLHPRRPEESTLVPKPGNRCTGSGVRDARSLHEHNNAIKLRRNTSRWWPHPRVRTSPEVGPGGHCRYPRTWVPSLAVSRQGPYSYPWLRPNSRTPVVRSPDSLDNGPGPVSRLGKIRERRVSRERRALSPNSRGSGPPVEPGPPRKSRTPDGVPDHLYSNRTPR